MLEVFFFFFSTDFKLTVVYDLEVRESLHAKSYLSSFGELRLERFTSLSVYISPLPNLFIKHQLSEMDHAC